LAEKEGFPALLKFESSSEMMNLETIRKLELGVKINSSYESEIETIKAPAIAGAFYLLIQKSMYIILIESII
jgi:hypothetical protein